MDQNNLSQNKFIVLEGIDGAGKSTLCHNLYENLKNKPGLDCGLFREPTSDSPYASELRAILSGRNKEENPDHNNGQNNEEGLLDLFMKDRLWDIENNLRPSIEKHRFTILDRYYFSTAAYQGRDFKEAEDIINGYLDNQAILQPDLLFYLKLEPQVALERISSRSESKDIFEEENRLNKISQNYDYIFTKMIFSFPVFILKADSTPEALTEFIISKLQTAT